MFINHDIWRRQPEGPKRGSQGPEGKGGKSGSQGPEGPGEKSGTKRARREVWDRKGAAVVMLTVNKLCNHGYHADKIYMYRKVRMRMG